MSFNQMTQHQLEEILSAGAAIEISKGLRTYNQLVDLAVCAKRNGGHLTFSGASALTHNQLIDIARAGSGHVSLKD
jgi:hypothetical protein